jgi:ribonuclease D
METSARPASRLAWIATPADLHRLVDEVRAAEWLALDTEFLREQTYYPKLCLIQLADERTVWCVDTLALPEDAAAALFERLERPQTVKIFHAASQDLEIFVQRRARAPLPLFDTQLAAALLGAGDQLGYAALVEQRLGIRLDKSLTRADWSRRPLPAPMLAYAAADVRYLADLYPRLRAELESCGRLSWLEEDCARLADPARYRNPPELAWKRLKGLWRLPASAAGAAAALAAWRESQAQALDRPRQWILDDAAIYRLAERRPTTRAQLEALAVLPPKTLARHGEALLGVLAAAPQAPPAAEPAPLTAEQNARLRELLACVRARAAALKLPASLLAPRVELEALLRHGAQAQVALLQGWRRKVLGEELLRRVG